MKTRRLGTALAIPVLAAGLLTSLSPAASAQAGETRQVPVTHSCVGVPYPNPDEWTDVLDEPARNPARGIPEHLIRIGVRHPYTRVRDGDLACFSRLRGRGRGEAGE